MSVWEHSGDPSSDRTPKTPDVDKHLPDNRPADGTTGNPTNISTGRSVNTKVVIRDGRILWVANNGKIVAAFAIVPEIDPATPLLIIAKSGNDVYTDVLGITRPLGL